MQEQTQAIHWTDPAAPIAVPSPHAHVIEREIDDELMLIDPPTGATFRLNDTAQFVWQACKQQPTLPELIAMYTAHYNVDTEQAADDVEQLFALFAGMQLLGGEAA